MWYKVAKMLMKNAKNGKDQATINRLLGNSQKPGMSTVFKIFMWFAIMCLLAALAIILIFNSFVCTVTFGLVSIFSSCNNTSIDWEQLYPITDKKLTTFAEEMKKAREQALHFADVGGSEYQEYTAVYTGDKMNEAEVHIRAVYQADWYAMQGIDLVDETFDEPESESEPDYRDTNLHKTYLLAKGVKDGGILSSDIEAMLGKAADWDFENYMEHIRFMTYKCFFLGEKCEVLNKEYKAHVDSEGEMIAKEDQGIVNDTYKVITQTWTCVTDPTYKAPSKGSATFAVPWIKFFVVPKVDAAQDDEVIPRGPAPDCGEGKKAKPGQDDVVVYLSHQNLNDALYAFEKYSLYDEVTVTDGDTYTDYIDYLLKELYEQFFGDGELSGVQDFSAGWLVPMEAGTYVVASQYGCRLISIYNSPPPYGCPQDTNDFHGGNDLSVGGQVGMPIYATKGGIVVFSNPNGDSPVGRADGAQNRDVGGYGGAVVIQHEDGSTATYGHMYRNDILVQQGWEVVQGQMIAGVGSNGGSTGPHLHINLCEKGGPPFDCPNSNPPGEGDDAEKEPFNYVYDDGGLNSKKTAAALKYFNDVKKKLKAEGGDAKREKLAQTFLMPGFTPGGGGGGDRFGYLAWKYETSYREPTYCSTGEGDSGGISCGIHQMSTNTQVDFVNSFLKSKGKDPYKTYYNELKGIQTGTQKFKEVFGRMDKPFGMEQWHQVTSEFFITRYWNHWVPRFKSKYGIDIQTAPYGFKEAVYARSIQNGPDNKVFDRANIGADLKAKKWESAIQKIYDEASAMNGGVMKYFNADGRNSLEVQRGVYNRLRYNESCDAKVLVKKQDLNLQKQSTGCKVVDGPLGG